MRRPEWLDNWKGWLPDRFYLRMVVRSRYFHADIRHAVKTILWKCGGVPSSNETADMLEKLAGELRAGQLS